MKIFYIEFNEFSYDQYKGFVVVAESEKRAIDFIKKKSSPLFIGYDEIDWESGYTIKEIKVEDYKKTSIILDSYNAG